MKSDARHEDHESFLRRFRLKISPTGIEKLDYAYDMAKYGHRNQFREDETRYFEHVRSTAIILVDELAVTDVEMIIAALSSRYARGQLLAHAAKDQDHIWRTGDGTCFHAHKADETRSSLC